MGLDEGTGVFFTFHRRGRPRHLHSRRAKRSKTGVAPVVDIRFQDYRDVSGQFDAVVGVEMPDVVGDNQEGRDAVITVSVFVASVCT
jgi:Mycolic acid cyclopropane synthetase